MQQWLLLGGGCLILLFAGIAWLVTRQIVQPVRHTANIAEMLAAGRLQERLAIRGTDELATLGISFNKMADSLQRQIRELEDLSRVQRRFVSDVSHELRTPLTTVRMAADVLHAARADFPPAVARSAELLQHELDRFEALLVDLLEISRHDARAAVLEADSVDVTDLVASLVDLSRNHAERTGCTLVTDLPEAPVLAEVDARRIQRVVRNLVNNALEHGERQPVLVTVRADADAVAISVRDHGVGLRPGESTLVFNRFWRADAARARSSGGTGLGLAIALEDARLARRLAAGVGRTRPGCQLPADPAASGRRGAAQLAVAARAGGRQGRGRGVRAEVHESSAGASCDAAGPRTRCRSARPGRPELADAAVHGGAPWLGVDSPLPASRPSRRCCSAPAPGCPRRVR